MERNYDKAFELVIGSEGGYQNDRRDRGNWTSGRIGKGELRGTKYGITAMSYPHLDIKNLTLDQAKGIYKADYWNKIKGDELPDGLDFLLFDIAINHGTGDAARWLQAAIGAHVDGAIGPRTLRRLAGRDVEDIILEVCATRGQDYARIKTVKVYGKGWYRRLTFTLLEAIDMYRDATLDESNEAPEAPEEDLDDGSVWNLFKRVS